MPWTKILQTSVYWAGPEKRFNYEFRRTTHGYLFVRYLPTGVRAGDPRARFLIVATYPLAGAYAKLKKSAHGKAIQGPGSSIVVVRPSDRRSVLIAWPSVPYEVEIYDPHPPVALATALSGRVRPNR